MCTFNIPEGDVALIPRRTQLFNHSNCTLPLVTPLECGEWGSAVLPAPITVQAVEYAAVQPVGYRIIAQECVEDRLCL